MQAASENYRQALCSVGDCYFSGNGAPKNFTQAYIYWMRSAQLGNPNAMFRLGDCYRFGWGVDENIASAIEWYSLAAENGCEDAKDALDDL